MSTGRAPSVLSVRGASRPNLIASAGAIDVLFVGSIPSELRRAECAYCHARTRGVRTTLLQWWYSHDCGAEDRELARRNARLILAQGGVPRKVAA